MSRVARKPIEVPEGITLSVEGQKVEVSNGKLTLNHVVHDDVVINHGDSGVHFSPSASAVNWALAGTSRALVANMVAGLHKSYEIELETVGVGYRVKQEGQKLVFTLGYSHPVEFLLPEHVEASVDKQVHLVIKSPIKALLGQTAANIIKLRKPDSYKGKGVQLKRGIKRLVKLKLKEVKKK
jgi:large subunit ribosomal protein L6